MTLLWALPVVAIACGIGLLLGWMRRIEELSLELLVAVHRTRDIHRPLEELRSEMARSEPLSERVWAHWSALEQEPPS
jgi:cytochrome c-type biogenesis protein CcmH/NrfF